MVLFGQLPTYHTISIIKTFNNNTEAVAKSNTDYTCRYTPILRVSRVRFNDKRPELKLAIGKSAKCSSEMHLNCAFLRWSATFDEIWYNKKHAFSCRAENVAFL